MLGYPEFGIRFEQRADFAPWAEACGGLGIRVDKADELEPAIAEAFAHPGPALVDVTVNPDEPPMPGKVTYEQAKGFLKAFLAGPAPQGDHRQHAVPGQDRGAQVVRRRRLGRGPSPARPRHRPPARQRPPRPLRTGTVRPDRRRGAHHRGRDLARARPGQLRQQDDVAAGRAHAGRGRRRGLAGVFSKRAAKTALPAGLGGGGRQQPAGPVPPPARGSPSARAAGSWPATTRRWARPTFAPLLFGLVGGMGLLAAVLRRER